MKQNLFLIIIINRNSKLLRMKNYIIRFFFYIINYLNICILIFYFIIKRIITNIVFVLLFVFKFYIVVFDYLYYKIILLFNIKI